MGKESGQFGNIGYDQEAPNEEKDKRQDSFAYLHEGSSHDCHGDEEVKPERRCQETTLDVYNHDYSIVDKVDVVSVQGLHKNG